MRIHLDDRDQPLDVDPESDRVEFTDDDSVLTQDEVDSIVQRRVQRAERSAREEALSDEEQVRQAYQDLYGVELRDDGRPSGAPTDEELQELRRRASQAEELEDRVREYESQIEETRRTRLENNVLTEAQGVRDGAEEDLLSAIERRMTYDDEYGWVATDGDGNVQFQGGEPVGVGGVVDELQDNKPFYCRDSSMDNGPSSEPSGDGSGSGKTWSRSAWEEAAQRTHEMSDDEFRDWDTAEEEGRIQE